MGRRPTKAADSPFCKARLNAAKYNDKLYSKEGASELLGLSVSTLGDYELGNTKVIPVDKVVLMADLYNAPELRNYYCTNMCPLGEDMPRADLADLDRLTVKAVSTFRKLEATKETLLDIAEDGMVSDDELSDMKKVLQNLEELEQITQSLKLWVRKNL